MKPKKDLTKGSISRNLFFLSLPVIGAMFMQNLFILVDTFFVAKLGSDAIAAISASFPAFFIIIALVSGLNVGISSFVARAIGAKKFNKINTIAENGIILALILTVVVTVVGLLTTKSLVNFLGVTESVGSLMTDYINIIYFGSAAFFLGHVANGMLHGEGDTKTPMKGFLIGTVLNLILDPIFIFGFAFVPAMGIKGAALATVIARSIGALYVFWQLFNGKSIVKLTLKKWLFVPSIIKEIFRVGVPTSASQLTVAVGIFFINKLVAGFGSDALAGFGIAFRVESLVTLPAMAIGIVTLAMVGQNFGAKEFGRAGRASLLAFISAFSLTALMGTMLFFTAPFWIGLFTQEPTVITHGANFFKIVGLTYGFLGLRFVVISSFQGLGKAGHALITTFLRFSSLLALAYVLALTLGKGADGIWIGIAISNVVMGLVSVVWFREVLKRAKKSKLEVYPDESVV